MLDSRYFRPHSKSIGLVNLIIPDRYLLETFCSHCRSLAELYCNQRDKRDITVTESDPCTEIPVRFPSGEWAHEDDLESLGLET
jgi:hypothetical protein